MSTRSRVLFTCAAALVAACAAPADKKDATTTGAAAGTIAEPNVAEVRAAIEAANTRSMAALVAGDPAGSAVSYGDDAVLMMPGMPMMSGRPAIEAGMKGMMDMMTVNVATPHTTEVMVSGDMAIETGTFEMTTTMKGAKPVADKGKYMTVWKRQADGSWKIIRDINNSDGAPPAVAK